MIPMRERCLRTAEPRDSCVSESGSRGWSSLEVCVWPGFCFNSSFPARPSRLASRSIFHTTRLAHRCSNRNSNGFVRKAPSQTRISMDFALTSQVGILAASGCEIGSDIPAMYCIAESHPGGTFLPSLLFSSALGVSAFGLLSRKHDLETVSLIDILVGDSNHSAVTYARTLATAAANDALDTTALVLRAMLSVSDDDALNSKFASSFGSAASELASGSVAASPPLRQSVRLMVDRLIGTEDMLLDSFRFALVADELAIRNCYEAFQQEQAVLHAQRFEQSPGVFMQRCQAARSQTARTLKEIDTLAARFGSLHTDRLQHLVHQITAATLPLLATEEQLAEARQLEAESIRAKEDRKKNSVEFEEPFVPPRAGVDTTKRNLDHNTKIWSAENNYSKVRENSEVSQSHLKGDQNCENLDENYQKFEPKVERVSEGTNESVTRGLGFTDRTRQESDSGSLIQAVDKKAVELSKLVVVLSGVMRARMFVIGSSQCEKLEKRMVCGLEDATIAEIDRVLVGLRAGKKKEERLKIRILRSNLRSSVTRGILRSNDEFLKLVELVRRDPVAVAIVMGRDGGKRHRALEKLKKVDSVGEAVDQFISSKQVSVLLYEITRALSEAPSTEARSAHTAELVTTATTIDSAPSKRERKKRRASSAGEAAVIPNENGKSVLKLSTILTQILTSILK